MHRRTFWRMTVAVAAMGIGWAAPARAESAAVLPDLAVTSSVSPSLAWVGDPVTLSFHIVNGGPVEARDPVFTSLLSSPFDAGFRFVSAPPGCAYVEEPSTHGVQRLVRCALEDIGFGGSTDIAIVVAYDQAGSRPCNGSVLAANEVTAEGEGAGELADNQTTCTVVTKKPLLDLPLGILRLVIGPPIRLTIG